MANVVIINQNNKISKKISQKDLFQHFNVSPMLMNNYSIIKKDDGKYYLVKQSDLIDIFENLSENARVANGMVKTLGERQGLVSCENSGKYNDSHKLLFTEALSITPQELRES